MSEQDNAPPQGDGKKQYRPSHTIYKPRKAGGGAASTWEADAEKECVWLEMAEQIGQMQGDDNAKFDWQNKKRIKLGLPDLGEIIAVLEKRQDGAGPASTGGDGKVKFRGLFHKNANGSASLAFEKAQNGGFYLKMGVQKGQEPVKSLSHMLTLGEGAVLLVLLKLAVERISRW